MLRKLLNALRPGPTTDRAASLDGLDRDELVAMIRTLEDRLLRLSVERAELKIKAETANAETQVWKAALSEVYEESKARAAAAILSQELAARGLKAVREGGPIQPGTTIKLNGG